MPEHDRDQSVEQMLRRVMSHDVPPQGECLDGETIAAWSEGSLRAAEASAIEHHVAGCARCRALMASFIRTTPVPPVAESLWRRWHLGWVVPLATAATAAAIWVALPDATPTQEANTIARVESSAEPLSAPSESQSLDAAVPQADARALQRQDQKAKVAEPVANEARERANASAAAPEVADLRAEQPATSSAAGAAAAPAAIAPAAPPPAAAPERAELDARKEITLRRAFAPDQITAPDGSSRWRIVNGQQVERSTDAGASWTPAALNSTDRLTAGSAPSATVCWIVGAGGSVYVTTDGTRFMRLPFTEMVDLTAVFAVDSLTATVSSADGRSWRTTNLGKTWTTAR